MNKLRIEGIRHPIGRSLTVEVESLAVGEGEVLTLLGKSGAGKSSLVRIMALLESPRAGRVLVSGNRATPRNNWARRQIAAALQNGVVWKGSVAFNVEFGLKIRGIGRRERARRTDETLSLVELEGYEDRETGTLSGGEAQRVALARALAVESKILFLDEPLSHIDEPLREHLASELRRHSTRTGAATVWVTHDRAEALSAGDRVAVMDEGRMLQEGPGVEVFTKPATEQVARLVGADNIIPGRIVESGGGVARIQVEGGELYAASSIPRGSQVFVLVRPEDISIHRDRLEASSPRNMLRARVSETVVLGALAKVYVDHPFPIVAAVTRPTLSELPITKGSQLWLSFKATSPHVIPHA